MGARSAAQPGATGARAECPDQSGGSGWPRENCHDPDADGWNGGTVAGNVVPKAVTEATCEMARELLIADRTTAPPGEGLKYENIGPNQTGYDKSDKRPVISHVAQAMLAKLGSLLKSKSGAVRLTRT